MQYLTLPEILSATNKGKTVILIDGEGGRNEVRNKPGTLELLINDKTANVNILKEWFCLGKGLLGERTTRGYVTPQDA